MKAKLLTFIAISAVVTLSFTFASVKNTPVKPKMQVSGSHANEPIGGIEQDAK